MDFDLGSTIAQLFQGLRGAASVFSHTDEEFRQDLPTMVKEGLRSRFAQPARPASVPGVNPGVVLQDPEAVEKNRREYENYQVTTGAVRG